MASFTVTDARKEEMTFAGTADQISITWHKGYFVDVTGVADPADVRAFDVLTAGGLPIVNRSIYTIDNRIIPYVVCRDKKARRNPSRLDRWEITTKWTASLKSTSEADNTPIAIPDALSDISPVITQSLGETERVLYEDKTSTTDDPRPILTPNGNFYSEPAIERLPTLTLQISQYEESITYEQMLERKLKVNESTYRSEPRYKWLVEQVEAVEVDVLLTGGLTTAALVTYTVTHSPHEYGWKDDRALIDSVYDDGSGNLIAFQEGALKNIPYGFIESDGTQKSGSKPDHEQFETFDTIDFESFLQI